jgi:hypothetical protein
MSKELELLKHKDFYELPDELTNQKDTDYYNDNNKTFYSKVYKMSEDGSSPDLATGKKTYYGNVIIYDTNDISKRYMFNKKYPKDVVSKLSISAYRLAEIKSLPKELKVLYIQGSGPLLKISAKIPKNIISIKGLWTAFPFNGYDLSKLKKLRVFNWSNGSIIEMPKFPKTIEYIHLKDSSLGFNFPKSLNNFKLSDFPNLKYFNLKGSGIKKKDIPQEWKDAKKSKNLKIYY